MSGPTLGLDDLVDTLQAEGLLGADDVIGWEAGQVAQPWYVRAMVGFGAWLASLLLIGFVASLSLMVEGGYAFVGLALITAAIFVRHSGEKEFLVQSSLAVSLAGQALLAYGVTEGLGFEQWEVFLGMVAVVSTALFFLFPDRVHRVLMVMFGVAALTTLLYVWEMNALVPVWGPLLALGPVALHRKMPDLVGTRFAPYLRPLTDGLMLSAFGVLLLSTVYILPELGVEFRFYPRPWVSTLLLGCLFLFLGTRIGRVLVPAGDATAAWMLYGLMALVIACAWAAPGLLFGLIVVMLGVECGRKSTIGAGIGFFAFFLASYFYGVEIGMQTKAAILVSTGLAILLLRWVVIRALVRGETDNV